MNNNSNELARALADAGGARAPRELSARLRGLLEAELARGRDELGLPRTGYGAPICVGFAPADRGVLAACPAPVELRADPGVVPERAALVCAAAVQALVEAVGPGPPRSSSELQLRAGQWEGSLTLGYAAGGSHDAAELAALRLEELLAPVDRLRCDARLLPGHVLEDASDLREPIGPTHPLRVAEAVVRLGGTPLDEDELERLEPALVSLLEPPEAVARAHEDPDPVRRVARRLLQRLDGMGKWGGYHTAFEHLARGYRGNERAVAYEVGEALLRAGLLGEKTSVGQRHVFLNPRRSGDIRPLIERGELPPGLQLPPAGGSLT